MVSTTQASLMKASLEARGTTVGVILDLKKKKKKVFSVDFNRSVMDHFAKPLDRLLCRIPASTSPSSSPGFIPGA